MKILVANNLNPFERGGAELLADHLVANLHRHGHEAELLRLPFAYEDWSTIPAQMYAARAFELYNVDRLIALKFPAFLLRHPAKVTWLLHQYRQAYDLFDAGTSSIPQSPLGTEFRDLVTAADTAGIGESLAVFTNSSVTARRLKHYNGLDSSVLLPPLNDPHLFVGGGDNGYIFAGGRINDAKRQWLLLEALALTAPAVRLVIAGPPSSPQDEIRLHARAAELGVHDRLTLEFGYHERSHIAELVNNARACAYIPIDEDSLGYVAMEAAQARKPIISCTDSGGVTQLVTHRSTGWLCEPQPDDLAAAMTAAVESASIARRYGRAAHDRWSALGVTWDATIERLTA